jgi:hypothetical protein
MFKNKKYLNLYKYSFNKSKMELNKKEDSNLN